MLFILIAIGFLCGKKGLINENAAKKMIASVVAKTGKAEEQVKRSYLSEGLKTKMIEMMEERSKRLEA